jgi:hypothetical protein
MSPHPPARACATWMADLLATATSPVLTRIEIIVPHHGEAHYSQILPWEALDSLLSDSARFPSLRQVSLAPQTATEADSLPAIADAQSKMLPRLSSRQLLSTCPDNSMYAFHF